MRFVTKEELSVILEKHQSWLNGEGGERAVLTGADLTEADLRGADLRGAVLRGAVLRGAVLRGADLRGADGIMPICCPEEGSFVGFKKASGYIVKLLITDDALRSSATSRKCRCSKAVVLSITNKDGSAAGGVTQVRSDRDKNFVYKLGETVEVPDFNKNRWDECTSGIHFFITRQEAVDY